MVLRENNKPRKNDHSSNHLDSNLQTWKVLGCWKILGGWKEQDLKIGGGAKLLNGVGLQLF